MSDVYICVCVCDIYDIYSCIELGMHVSSLSEPMNAIMLAQVGVEPGVEPK